jgi:small subunit ribosomal protein S1
MGRRQGQLMERKRTPEKKMPVYDDGWWASVLAEEEQRAAAGTVKTTPKQEESKPTADWVYAQKVFAEDEIVTLTVTGFNRGGLLVEGSDLYGFVPCSHLVELPYQADESHRDDCLTAYLGRSVRLKVIECVPDEGRMVFSERAARTEAGKRPALFSATQPGQRLQGEVTNVTDFGVFVDLGGVEGLVHISELSWGRVLHPSQICQVGQHVEVLVLDITPERCRIALSLKRLQVNPWETAQERYPVNAVFPAVVTALVPFGAFARLEEGLEGLIHASEMELPPKGYVRDLLTIGQEVRVRILLVEPTRQRLGLSMKID